MNRAWVAPSITGPRIPVVIRNLQRNSKDLEQATLRDAVIVDGFLFGSLFIVTILPPICALLVVAVVTGTMTHLQAGLSPETLEKAKVELKENPDTLHQDIQEVRDMIITRPDIGFLRTDDPFILRFLRARKFNHFEAFRLLAQYFEYRQQNLDMFKNLKPTDPGIKQALKDGFPGVLLNLDRFGRKILVLFAANWD